MKYNFITRAGTNVAEQMTAFSAKMRDAAGNALPTLDYSEVCKLVLHGDDAANVYDPVIPAEYGETTVWDDQNHSIVVPGRIVGALRRTVVLKLMGPMPTHNESCIPVLNKEMVELLVDSASAVDSHDVGELGCFDVRRNKDGDYSGRCHTKMFDEYDTTEGYMFSVSGLHGIATGEWITLVTKQLDFQPCDVEFRIGGMRITNPMIPGKSAYGVTIPGDCLKHLRIYALNLACVHMFFRTGGMRMPYDKNAHVTTLTGPVAYANYSALGSMSVSGLLPSTPLYAATAAGVQPHVLKMVNTVVFGSLGVVINTVKPVSFAWVVPGTAAGRRIVVACMGGLTDEQVEHVNAVRQMYSTFGNVAAVSEQMADVKYVRDAVQVHTRKGELNYSYVAHPVGTHWPVVGSDGKQLATMSPGAHVDVHMAVRPLSSKL